MTSSEWFNSNKIKGKISAAEAERLLDDKDLLRGHQVDLFDYTAEYLENSRQTASTCGEWLILKEKNFQTDSSNASRAGEIPFVIQCGAMLQISRAHLPLKSFISRPRIGVSSMKFLPVTLLPTETDEEQKELMAYVIKDASYQDLVKKDKIDINSQTKNSLQIEYNGTMQKIVEVARSDFDGDGIEDILAVINYHAIGGTLFGFNLVFMARKSSSSKFLITSISTL